MSLKSSPEQHHRPASNPIKAAIRQALFTLLSFAMAGAAQANGKHEVPPLNVEEISPVSAISQPIDLTAQTDDLWSRLRNGFAMPNLNNELVNSYQQRYMSQPEYLRRMVERSRRYMHHIVGELEKRGMPTEIALLPMVESAMNPMAYSRAHASGLWQFIPSTGRSYNLTQDWWMDERRDVVASTNAALDYLQTIYELHGDWHLALASYNWGENAVGRAIRRNEAAGLPTDYDSLNMPKETRHYVPKLQALKNIFGNPALLTQLDLPPLSNKPYFATVSHPAPIDVKVAAKLANMPVDEFVALNPAHNRPVIKGDTKLMVPTEKLSTFISNLKDYARPLASWQTYTLKFGERLEAIAPRFGVTLEDLKRVNGLQGRFRLAEGQTLLVPAKDGVGALDDAPNETTSLPPMAAMRYQGPAAPAPKTHTVRKGDTLPALAKQYGISVAEIKRVNKLKSASLKAGTHLTMGTPSAAQDSHQQAAATRGSKAQAKGYASKGADKQAKGAESRLAKKSSGKAGKESIAKRPAGRGGVVPASSKTSARKPGRARS